MLDRKDSASVTQCYHAVTPLFHADERDIFFQQSFSFRGWDDRAWKSGVCVERLFFVDTKQSIRISSLLKSKRTQAVSGMAW